ncbi:MAG: L-histidine N(alpha)-methyltransferase [Pseudomonadota bacterium]
MDRPTAPWSAEHDAFAKSAIKGLTASPKAMEPRWLYDSVGAKLFEAITKLDHYYLTRTETALIKAHAGAIADALGDGVTIVEPGSGEALKVRPILSALGERAQGYVPIDIASEQLESVVKEMAALFPDLSVEGIATDFFRPFEMDKPSRAVVFFPGSTIGNMSPSTAVTFLRDLQMATGAARFLIGFDLVKDRKVLVEAYDDPAGVTAAFKKNLLQRMNRELGANFDLSKFQHRAYFAEDRSAIRMGMVAMEALTVTVAGQDIQFAEGEELHTEDSRKYTLESFAEFAAKADLVPVQTWTDARDYFAVMLLEKS